MSDQHQEFITEMLYQAIYVPEGEQPPSREVIEDNKLKKYYEDIGKDTDFGYIAVNSETNEFLGAIWLRLFDENNKGWGFVNSDTPELSMAILQDYRGFGIGTRLLEYLIKNSIEKYPNISLSVDPSNYAKKLYQKYGFEEIGENEGAIVMIMKRE